MITPKRHGCIDCGKTPICTMVCDPCLDVRAQRDGDQWFPNLCADFEELHPELIEEHQRKAARRRTNKKEVVGWDGKVIST